MQRTLATGYDTSVHGGTMVAVGLVAILLAMGGSLFSKTAFGRWWFGLPGQPETAWQRFKLSTFAAFMWVFVVFGIVLVIAGLIRLIA
jgi:ABC-type xylose transport system permease subunit